MKEQQTNQQTQFQVMKNFQRPPPQSFLHFSGECYLEKESSINIGIRTKYNIKLVGSILTIKQKDTNEIILYADYNAVSITNYICDKDKSCFYLDILWNQGTKIYIWPYPPYGQSNQNQVQSWNDKLKQCRIDNKGHNFTRLNSVCPEFMDTHKVKHISSADFEQKANTGDLILFKSRNYFFNTKYIGLVLRDKNNQIFILHPQKYGCGLSLWSSNFYAKPLYGGLMNLYKKICWRPLTIDLTPKDIQQIRNFVQTSIKPKVGSTQKLINLQQQKIHKKKKSEIKPLDVDGYLEKCDEKICSQLVAQLYLKLGILDQKKKKQDYRSKHFFEINKQNIKRMGVELQDQILIV